MPKTAQLQTSFGAGELSPEMALRRDVKQYRDGAKSLLNSRILMVGGVTRRPGTLLQAALLGDARIEDFVVNATIQYVVVFSAARFDAYARDITTGLLTAAGSLTACPWTGTEWQTMDFAASGNTIILTRADFLWTITRTGASSWTQAAWPWFTGSSGRIHQPHYRIAPLGVTVLPSALSGTATMTASAAYWAAGHVNGRLRILDREVRIDSLTSSTVANITILEKLRPYQNLTVADSDQFQVDDVVEGTFSGAKGIVTAVPDATHIHVVLIGSQIKFQASTVDTTETVQGPTGASKCTGVADTSPEAVSDWTEQLYSATNGYPAATEIHRSRVLFAGSAAAPNAVAGSSIANIYDFDVGTGDDADGFLETIGDSAASQIVQMHSAEQLLVLTDRGPYYVPETAQNPFKPSSIAFNKFGEEWPCASVRVGSFDGGAVMVAGSSIIKLAPTGDLTHIWEGKEVSFLCPHLVKAPSDSAFTTNFEAGPERYGLFVNSDGTLAVMMLVDDQEVRNFVPWTTEGVYRSLCSIRGDVYCVVKRTINGVDKYWLEKFDSDLTLDGVTQYATEAALNSGVLATYGGEDIHVVSAEGYDLGVYPLVGNVAFDEFPAGPFMAGFAYDRVIETLPPHVQSQTEGDRSGSMMRITTADVHVYTSALFQANGTELTAYQAADDLSQPPPLWSGVRRFRLAGWKRSPTLRITQPYALPLTVLGISLEVAY